MYFEELDKYKDDEEEVSLNEFVRGKVYKTKDIQIKEIRGISYGKLHVHDKNFIGDILVNWGNKLQENDLRQKTFVRKFLTYDASEERYTCFTQFEALERLSKYSTYQAFYASANKTGGQYKCTELEKGTYDIYISPTFTGQFIINDKEFTVPWYENYYIIQDVELDLDALIATSENSYGADYHFYLVKHGKSTKFKYKSIDKSTAKRYTSSSSKLVNEVDEFLKEVYGVQSKTNKPNKPNKAVNSEINKKVEDTTKVIKNKENKPNKKVQVQPVSIPLKEEININIAAHNDRNLDELDNKESLKKRIQEAEKLIEKQQSLISELEDRKKREDEELKQLKALLAEKEDVIENNKLRIAELVNDLDSKECDESVTCLLPI